MSAPQSSPPVDNLNLKRLRLDLAYHGLPFCGWQIQPEQLSVQGALMDAFKTLYKKDIRVIGAGRTDAGVHALQQVAHVDLPTSGPPTHKLLRSLNALTPDELLITHIEEVPMDFHARFSPHIKTYVYQFDFHDRPHPMLKDRAAHMRLPIIKWDELSLTAKNFVGTHDFGSFCSIQNTSESTVRSILDSHLDQITEYQLQFVIKGKGFLQHMVRILAGTLMAVGQGTLQREIVLEALKTGEGFREQLGLTLPAHGLHLKSTEYLHRDYWDSAEISPNIKASDETS